MREALSEAVPLPATALFSPVQNDLALVDDRIARVGSVEYPVLATLLSHVLQTRGKRLRPALVLLAARPYDYPLDRLIPLASAIELLHTATLIHDDLVDGANTRRGAPTLHSLTSQRATVLVGDYIFATSAALCTETQNTRVMAVFGETLRIICDGELQQIFSAGQWPQRQDDYYRKISAKTASLIRTATETGAILGGAPESELIALRDYGFNLGMAFQIVDDILDFVADEATLGKPTGSDLRQGTITLPTIRYLESDPDCPSIRRAFDGDGDVDAAVREAVALILSSDAIEYARSEAHRFSQLAAAAIAHFPASPTHRALDELTDYVIERAN